MVYDHVYFLLLFSHVAIIGRTVLLSLPLFLSILVIKSFYILPLLFFLIVSEYD